MGVYLNPGATMLRQGRRSRIYVDKSTLVSYLNGVINTERKYVCVSRPRRFGKSMAANMVSAYYDRTVDQEGQRAYLDFLRVAQGQAVRRPLLHDGDPAHQEVRHPFGAQHVRRVQHGRSRAARAEHGLHRARGG